MHEERDFDVPNDQAFSTSTRLDGFIELGELRYAVYSTPNVSLDERHNLSEGKILRGVMVYRPEGEPMLPDHYIACRGDLKGSPREQYHCNISIDFDKSDNLVAHSRMIWVPNAGFQSSPFNFDNLDIYIEALITLFEQIEVHGD